MYYYDPDNKSPRRWAMIATAVYGVLLAGSFALVSFDFSPVTDKPGDTILVDFTEPPVPEPPRPPVPTSRACTMSRHPWSRRRRLRARTL